MSVIETHPTQSLINELRSIRDDVKKFNPPNPSFLDEMLAYNIVVINQLMMMRARYGESSLVVNRYHIKCNAYGSMEPLLLDYYRGIGFTCNVIACENSFTIYW